MGCRVKFSRARWFPGQDRWVITTWSKKRWHSLQDHLYCQHRSGSMLRQADSMSASGSTGHGWSHVSCSTGRVIDAILEATRGHPRGRGRKHPLHIMEESKSEVFRQSRSLVVAAASMTARKVRVRVRSWHVICVTRFAMLYVSH